jgi:hypothetical protein
MRWNPRDAWVSSRRQAHPAIVSVEDFERAQHTRTVRQTRRTYLLRGLLRCELCGRRMESAWNNGRANYRCHHSPAAEPDLPRSVSVREDKILAHLAALLIRYETEIGPPQAPEDVGIPHDVNGQVAMCRERGLTLGYDHLAQSLTTDGHHGTITVQVP